MLPGSNALCQFRLTPFMPSVTGPTLAGSAVCNRLYLTIITGAGLIGDCLKMGLISDRVLTGMGQCIADGGDELFRINVLEQVMGNAQA